MEKGQLETNTYSHMGIVSKKEGNSLVVSLDENVHCESCRAKATCGISDASNKQIEITNPTAAFKINEQVQVVLKKELGLKAVLWAYVFPFLLMLFTLLLSSAFLIEWMAGLLALLVLIPYYAILYSLRDVFRKKFRISVIKI